MASAASAPVPRVSARVRAMLAAPPVPEDVQTALQTMQMMYEEDRLPAVSSLPSRLRRDRQRYSNAATHRFCDALAAVDAACEAVQADTQSALDRITATYEHMSRVSLASRVLGEQADSLRTQMYVYAKTDPLVRPHEPTRHWQSRCLRASHSRLMKLSA